MGEPEAVIAFICGSLEAKPVLEAWLRRHVVRRDDERMVEEAENEG